MIFLLLRRHPVLAAVLGAVLVQCQAGLVPFSSSSKLLPTATTTATTTTASSTNPYDTVRLKTPPANEKKKGRRNTRTKRPSKLVLNTSTCRDISYQLVRQWDLTFPSSLHPASATTALGQALAPVVVPGLDVLQASTFTQCPSPQKILSDTIDLVCHLRTVVQPKITMVTLPRCLATAWLTLAALRLPLPSGAGHIVETGTWRGGMSILSIMLIKRYGHCSDSTATAVSRKFWAFDSFQGLPTPKLIDRYNGKQGQWSVSIDEFIANLRAFNVYPSDIVIITPGFFNDTLQHTAVDKISFLRLDGDLYESTKDALRYLYDKVVMGGFIYVDDYNSFVGCKLAVDEFLGDRGLNPSSVLTGIKELDYEAREGGFAVKTGEAVWWQKQ